MKRLGILTGGGDAPGLNAVIRAVVYAADKYNLEIMAFREGWAGVLGGDIQPLKVEDVEDIHRQGGTIIGTSRTNPFKIKGGINKVKRNLKKYQIDGLIAVGGEDTLGVAHKLSREGVKVIGVPKTIDNDLSATDYTFGFDTAINRAMEAIDGLHTTAKSHQRVLVVEIMGRHAGWMTLEAGMAGGAHIILIPEVPFDIEDVCKIIKRRKRLGKRYTIVAVAEGAVPKGGSTFITQELKKDEFGHVRLGGVAKALEKEIEKRTGIETRSVILGHTQRGGAPSAFDRYLATRFGLKAAELARKGEFGKMVSLQGTRVVSVDLEEAVGKLKMVDKSLYQEAKIFFG